MMVMQENPKISAKKSAVKTPDVPIAQTHSPQDIEWYEGLLIIPDIKEVIAKEGGEEIYNGGPEYRPAPAERPFGLLKWLAAAASRASAKLLMDGAKELRQSVDPNEDSKMDVIFNGIKTGAGLALDAGAISLAVVGRLAMLPIDAARYYYTLPNSIEALGYQTNRLIDYIGDKLFPDNNPKRLEPIPVRVSQ